MNALEKAQQAIHGYETFVAENDMETPIAIAWAREAVAYATIAQAESLERIAMHLGNIHQTLITPDMEGQPTGVFDKVDLPI
jgi:urease accessory protein UreE